MAGNASLIRTTDSSERPNRGYNARLGCHSNNIGIVHGQMAIKKSAEIGSPSTLKNAPKAIQLINLCFINEVHKLT